MERKCEGCEIAEKYKYWSELPTRKHQFFKIMVADFNQQLRFPKKFMNCFKVKLSSRCTLIGPSKSKWNVKLSSTNEGRTAFTYGWDQFVCDNGVKINDFLVFQFVGNSSFEVSVFEFMSGCEREGCYFSVDSKSSSSTTPCTSILHDNQVRMPKVEMDLDDSSSEGEDEEESDGCFSTEGKLPQAQKYFKSNRRDLKPEEKRRGYKMAECYKRRLKEKGRNFPMFQITMLPTHVYRGFNLTIPKVWARKYMIKETHDVELQVSGTRKGRWRVGCRWTKGGSIQCQLRSRWPIFVKDNNLEQHDTCVFELIQRGDSNGAITPIFDVHIFRAVDHIVPLTLSTRMV